MGSRPHRARRSAARPRRRPWAREPLSRLDLSAPHRRRLGPPLLAARRKRPAYRRPCRWSRLPPPGSMSVRRATRHGWPGFICSMAGTASLGSASRESRAVNGRVTRRRRRSLTRHGRRPAMPLRARRIPAPPSGAHLSRRTRPFPRPRTAAARQRSLARKRRARTPAHGRRSLGRRLCMCCSPASTRRASRDRRLCSMRTGRLRRCVHITSHRLRQATRAQALCVITLATPATVERAAVAAAAHGAAALRCTADRHMAASLGTIRCHTRQCTCPTRRSRL